MAWLRRPLSNKTIHFVSHDFLNTVHCKSFLNFFMSVLKRKSNSNNETGRYLSGGIFTQHEGKALGSIPTWLSNKYANVIGLGMLLSGGVLAQHLGLIAITNTTNNNNNNSSNNNSPSPNFQTKLLYFSNKDKNEFGLPLKI